MSFTCDKGFREPPAINVDELNDQKKIVEAAQFIKNFFGFAIASAAVNPEVTKRVEKTQSMHLGTGTHLKLSGDDGYDKFYEQMRTRDLQPNYKPAVDEVENSNIGNGSASESYTGMGGEAKSPEQLVNEMSEMCSDYLEANHPALARKLSKLKENELSVQKRASEVEDILRDLEQETLDEIEDANEAEEVEGVFDLMRAFLQAMAQQTILLHQGSQDSKKLKQELNRMIDALTPKIQSAINGKGRFVASALSAGLGVFGAGCGLLGAASIFSNKFPTALNPSNLSTIKTVSKAGSSFGMGTSQASGTVSGMFQAYDGSKQAGLQADQSKLTTDRQAESTNTQFSQQVESLKGQFSSGLQALHSFISNLMQV